MPPYDGSGNPYGESGKQNSSSVKQDSSENPNALMTWGWISIFIGLVTLDSSGIFSFIPILIGGAMLVTGYYKKQAMEQAIASGHIPKGQMDVKSGAVWGPVDKVMSRVDNPDTFVHNMPTQGSRSLTAQQRMDAQFHGDNIDEFRGDELSNFAEHDFSHHAPDGFPSAIPGDFHDASRYWHNPEAIFSDPYA